MKTLIVHHVNKNFTTKFVEIRTVKGGKIVKSICTKTIKI